MFNFVEFARSNPAAALPAGAPVLGIEVTMHDQSVLCALGNVDGQHDPVEQRGLRYAGCAGRVDISTWVGRAAIDIATEIPLPPDGTVLATTRADLDSVGAMAVIVLRQLHEIERADGFRLRLPLIERIRRVCERDCFRPSADWQPRPLPPVEHPWGEPTTVDSDRDLAHVASICSPRPGEPALPMAERVAIVACWLLWGDPQPCSDGPGTAPIWGSPMVACDIYDACGVTTEHPYSHAAAAIADARVRVEAARRALAEEAAMGAVVGMWRTSYGTRVVSVRPTDWQPDVGHHGQPPASFAIVRARHAGALGLGHCVAPVVVAFDQAIPGKVTICGWSGPNGRTRYLDMPTLRARLNRAESDVDRERGEVRGGAWGGPPAMCCSPQVLGGTRLSEAQIIEAVLACLA